MGTLNQTYLSLADWAKRTDPDGKASTIVEVLSEVNDIVDDAGVLEANNATSHRTTVRSGLPNGTWRKLNYGVQPEKSRTVQVDDTIGMLESYSEVDKKLADLSGNTKEFRMQEDKAFIEGMSQTFADTLFYGDTDNNPERFMGLAPRYSSKSATNGGQIIDAGGTGSDNTSIWFVTWGPDTCHLIFPKGSKAGLQMADKGQQTKEDSTKGNWEIYRSHYSWDVGLCLRDWRYHARIANIDVSELLDAGESGFDGAELINLMIEAYHKIQHIKPGLRIYANRSALTALDKLAANKDNLSLSSGEYAGKPVTMFRNIPIRLCEAITDAESQVA